MGIAIAAAGDEDLAQAQALLRASRPAAPSVARGIRDVMRDGRSPSDLFRSAQRMHTDAIAARRTMSLHAAARIPRNASVLTQCDTGALVHAGHGTALGAIRAASRLGKLRHVFVIESRRTLGRSRFTSWELERSGIRHTIIDDEVAQAMLPERVTNVVIGADRIATNGDTARRLGTRDLAAECARHGVQLDVVAPTSTVDGRWVDPSTRIDPCLPTDVAGLGAEGVVDITPSELISAIVTEIGVHEPPYNDALADAVLTSASIHS